MPGVTFLAEIVVEDLKDSQDSRCVGRAISARCRQACIDGCAKVAVMIFHLACSGSYDIAMVWPPQPPLLFL